VDLYAVPFPRTVLHLVEYLQARADEPCGLSALEGVASGFAFMEDACGFPRGQRLVDVPLFDAYYKELVAGYAGAGKEPLRQAPRYPLCFVLALEREVVDEEVAACYRCHAWWHLLSLWAALRFDDHRGLSPGAIRMTPRGLEAVLSRTKTSGPGKRVSELPLIVSSAAFLREPAWLSVGWELWKVQAPFVRDYFLVKPAASLDATVPVELSYEQSSRLSRAVLSGLPRESDVLQALGEPVVGLFTQHSARCWLPSLAALAQVPEADLAFLGRWSPTSAKGYVRTATEVIARIQGVVASRLKEAFRAPSGEPLGEQSAYIEMRRELLRRRFTEEQVDGHLDELQLWTSQLAAEGADGWYPLGAPVPIAEGPAVCAVGVGRDPDGDVPPEEDGLAASPTPPCGPASSAAAPPPLPVEDESQGPPSAGYVVSLSRTDWRRLHRFGGCPRLPGVHYLRFELLGLGRPAPDAYDDFCKQCWKVGSPDEPSDEEDSETDLEEGEAPLLVEEPAVAAVPVFAEFL